MRAKPLKSANVIGGNPTTPSFAGGRFELSDVGQLSTIFQDWRGRFDQLNSGPFAAELRVVSGESVRAITIGANRRVHARGGETSGVISVYPVTRDNAESLWHGHRLLPGQLVVHGLGSETDHCSSRASVIRGVSVSPVLLHEAIRVFLNRDDRDPPRGWDVQTLPPRIAAALLKAHARLIARGTSRRLRPDQRDVRRLEQDCLRALVEALSQVFPSPERQSLPARSRLILRAEEFMRSRIGDPFGALDLCRELGVSDRTLRLAFQERYGLGPMAYFKSLRLNAVRSLLRATPEHRVATAAWECGFRHMGNFAADYFRLFGERPMDTLGNASPDSFTRGRA